MPVLDRFACAAGPGAGFVVPLFSQHPGANLLQIQKIDERGGVTGFDDIGGIDGSERPTDKRWTVEIGDPAVWAFSDAKGGLHVGGRDALNKLAPELLSPELINGWPASAADLIRLCELEHALPDQTRRTYAAMVELLGAGAAIWRDTDVILPLVRQHFGAGLAARSTARLFLSEIWTISVGEVCHIYCPDELLNVGATDLSKIAETASRWGIVSLELHPQRAIIPPQQPRSLSWPVIGHGGVGRWTVRKMFKAVGPVSRDHIRARIGGRALEASLAVPCAKLPGNSTPPNLQIVIHGSAPGDVDAGVRLFGGKRVDIVKHVVNVRPLGTDPERQQAVPARRIAEAENGPDFVWVIANHRPRRIATHYVGLARSQVASRFARAGISTLADLCQSSRGRSLVQQTAGTHELGLVGATRFLAGMSMGDLLLRVLYSMLSPEWTFTNCKHLVCLWPRPLLEGKTEYIRLGNYQYPVEMIGLKQPSARADIRCLAFGVSERRGGILPYADYLVSVMAAWDWSLRSDLGEEMLFEDQGGVILMLVADTPAKLDNILHRDRYSGPVVDIVVTNKRLTAAQSATADALDWPVIHHSDLPEWIQREFGEPGQLPLGGRIFPVE